MSISGSTTSGHRGEGISSTASLAALSSLPKMKQCGTKLDASKVDEMNMEQKTLFIPKACLHRLISIFFFFLVIISQHFALRRMLFFMKSIFTFYLFHLCTIPYRYLCPDSQSHPLLWNGIKRELFCSKSHTL